MLATLKLAWRNIWRNRRRTLISMSAVALGLMVVLVYGSMIRRMLSDAKNQLDNTGLGHVEITGEGWRARRPVNVVIDPAVVERLSLPPGSEVAARLLSRGLLTSAHGNEAVEVHGVDWQSEVQVASYLRDIRKGALPEDGDAGIVIGDGLAERMQLDVGHKVRLMTQTADGEMGAQLFRVRGIFHALSSQISDRRIIVARAQLEELTGVHGVHQIVIQLDRAAESGAVAADIKRAIGPGHDVMTYFEIFPTFAQMEKLMDSVQTLMAFFVYFLVGLGIMNTMLMSVLERTRELGVLQALGTRPGGIVALILAESFWIATMSVVVGLALGLGINAYGSTGLVDFSQKMGEGIELGGAVMNAKMSTSFSLRESIGPAAYVYVMALIVGLYPAWRITRMRVVEALRAR